MVSARLVDAAKISSEEKVPILCALGPTAVVKLQTGSWKRESRVVVAPNLPVDVLLGTDLHKASAFKEGQVGRGLAVLTRAQRRGRGQKKREEQRWEDKKELKGKEDCDETKQATIVQEETFRVETLDDSQVEGRSECESVAQRAVECQEKMTEDEADGEMEEGEMVIENGEDAGEVGRSVMS